MKNVFRTCGLIILLVTLSSVGNFVKAESSNNLFENGSFEQVQSTNNQNWTDGIAPTNWDIWLPGGKPQLSIDEDIVYEGEKSIRIDAEVESRADVLQNIAVSPGKNYKFSVMVKTEDVDASWGGVFVRTQYLDSQGKKISSGPETKMLKGINDWQLLNFNISPPEKTAEIKIELFLESATGTAWFDDARFIETDDVFVSGITLQESSLMLEKGETFQLIPIIKPENAMDQSVTWRSADESVATVDDAGVVTAIDYGYTEIIATTVDGGIEARALINVESAETIAAYDQLRIRWSKKLTGNDVYDANDPEMAKYVQDLEKRLTNDEGTGRWDTLNRAEDRKYLWENLQSTTDSAQISTAYGIIRDMAMAYTMIGSSLYQDEQLKIDTLAALEWMDENRYGVHKNPYGNWWDWEIGTPQILNNIIVLMYDELTTAEVDKYMNTIHRFVPNPKKRLNGVTETGANLLDKALVASVSGVIEKNGARISQGSDSIGDEFRYATSGEGVYKDGSLIQHSDIAYTGSYGAVWMNRAADMLYLLNDSPWHITDPHVNNVYDWVPTAFEPLIYKGAMMDMVRGRAISRVNESDHKSGRGIVLSILRLSQAATPENEKYFKSLVKEMIETDQTHSNYAEGLPIYEMSLVKSLVDDDSIQARGALIKNHVFAGMDRIVHLRPQFGFGISMFSDRISAFSFGNGENKKGWHTGSGMTYLYNDDLDHYSNDYWPTVDSDRLPGTTTDHSKGTLVDWKSYLNPNKWVGGATLDGLYGTAGMEFSLKSSTGSSLQGKKSWFMFDDEIIALGTDISSSDHRLVETIIENRQINDDNSNALTIDGEVQSNQLGNSDTLSAKWAHLEGNEANTDIGYYFPEQTDVYTLREARTGTWDEINTGSSKEKITRNYVSLAVNHGEQPENESYNYVLLPNKTVEETKQYSENPDVSIISQTSDIHAVKKHSLGITAANFWNEGTVDFIRSYQSAAVLIQEKGNELTIAISDPTKVQDEIIIEVEREGLLVSSKDDAITVSQSEPSIKIAVDTKGAIGKTFTVKLNYEKNQSVESIIQLIQELSANNEFYTNGAEKSITMHMKAVSVFEKKQDAKKVIKHMGSFYVLLDSHRKNMSPNAYDLLKTKADRFIESWK